MSQHFFKIALHFAASLSNPVIKNIKYIVTTIAQIIKCGCGISDRETVFSGRGALLSELQQTTGTGTVLLSESGDITDLFAQ